jgi:hypothetical protein
MRKIFSVISFLLIFGASALAQKKESTFVIHDARPIDAKSEPLFIIDNIIYKGNLDSINTNNILVVNILKDSAVVLKYGQQALNGVVEIITKSAAKLSYQLKIGAFSKEYKNYLEQNQNKDDSVAYIVNGIFLSDIHDASIKTLYNLSKDQIVNVFLKENPWLNGNKTKYLAVITTKQN